MRMIVKTGKRMAVAVCLILCLAVFLPAFPARAAEQRVFDDAGLLSDTQIESVEETISRLRTEWGMDLVVVTTNDTGGKSSRDYADDYYEAGGFGTEDYSGALFLIDMDHRELTLSTEGEMIRYLTDARVERVLDAAYAGAADGDYYRAITDGIHAIDGFVKDGIVDGQYNYDTETGRVDYYRKRSVTMVEGLVALVVAGVVAAIPCININREYAMKAENKASVRSALAYRQNCQFAYGVTEDKLINQFVTHRVIPRQTSSGSHGGGRSSGARSSTHRSSSGRSHGGGSRRF